MDIIYWNNDQIKKKTPPPHYNVFFAFLLPGGVKNGKNNIVVGGRGVFQVVPKFMSMIV